MNKTKKVICYFSASSGDWGGASRVLFTTLKFIDRKKYEPIVLIPDKGPVTPLLEKLGIKYLIWGQLHEPEGLVKYVKDFVKSIRMFRNHKIDVFDINHCDYWRPAELLAARFLRIPIVTRYHTIVEKPEPAPFVKMSSLLVANSEFTATTSETDNVPIDVIYPTVDIERFDNAKDVRHDLYIPDHTVVIGFIGQIKKIKGVDLFIDLAKNIGGKDKIFLIVGSCRNPNEIGDTYTEESLNAAIENADQIKYMGYRYDVENLYKTSDVIIMPSRWDEPFGLINIEAGAAMKPIVATRVGGIPEIINHGGNGFLVDRGDIDSLLYYTKKLIEDKNLRLEMGKRNRQVVEEKFTDQPIRKLENLYDSL